MPATGQDSFSLILEQLSNLRDDVKELKSLTSRVVKIETEFQSRHDEIKVLAAQLSDLRSEMRDISEQIAEIRARDAVIEELKSAMAEVSHIQAKIRPYAEIANRVILFGGAAALGAWLAHGLRLLNG